MLVWILGCEGLLGRCMQSVLMQRQIPFFATNRLQADITDLHTLQSIASARRPTHIVNCSAYNKVDQAEKEPDLAYAVNAQGPENLGKISGDLGIKVIHISTDYVFDGEKTTPYLETDRCNPQSIYGKSKLEGEKKLLASLPLSCVVRTSWLFGKDGINFISKVPKLFKAEEELEIEAKQINRPTYCLDLAEALIELLPVSGIFHFATGKPCTRFEIAKELFEVAKSKNLPIKCRKVKPQLTSVFSALRPNYSVMDTSKVEKFLKIKPRPWSVAVEEFLHA